MWLIVIVNLGHTVSLTSWFGGHIGGAVVLKILIQQRTSLFKKKVTYLKRGLFVFSPHSLLEITEEHVGLMYDNMIRYIL